MTTADDRISVRDASDRFRDGPLGMLTDKQMAALQKCADLSPGYHFAVLRYNGNATHVTVWADGNDRDYVGLVGRDCVQYYDQNKATEAVVKRVAHRVYRFSGFTIY